MKAFRWIVFLFFLSGVSAYADTDACQLSHDFVFQRAIEKSDEARLEALNIKDLENDMNDFDAMYDARVSASLSHQIDKSDRVLTIFGTRADTTRFETKYQQDYEFGLSSEFGYRHTREKNNSTFVTINPAHNAVWFGTLSVPLLQSVQKSNQILRDSFRYGVESASFTYEFVRQQVGYGAIQTYILWIQAKKEIALAEEALSRAKTYLGTTQKLYNDGLVEKSSYFAAQSNVSSRTEDVLATKTNYEALKQDLQHILKIDIDEGCVYHDITYPQAQKQLTDYTSNVSNRDDIKAFDRRMESFETSLGAYRNDLLPNLRAFTTLEINDVDDNLGSAFGESFTTFQPNWIIGGEISVPIGRTESRTKVRRAYIQMEKIKVQKEKLLREVNRDVQSAWDTIHLLDLRIEKLEEAKVFESKKIQATKKEYELGRESFLTLLLFEQDFIQMKRALLQLKAQKANQQYLLELLSGNMRDEIGH